MIHKRLRTVNDTTKPKCTSDLFIQNPFRSLGHRRFLQHFTCRRVEKNRVKKSAGALKKKKASWFPFEGVTWKLSLDVTFLKPICKKKKSDACWKILNSFVSDFVAVIPNTSENNHWVAYFLFFFPFHSGNCRKEQSNADTRTSKTERLNARAEC